MTGYGHTTFYLKKADFGFLRIAQVLVRLNLLTIALAYAMNTDYLFYYFAPLVSFWFLIIYATLFVGSRFNDRISFVLAKIIISMTMTTTIFTHTYLLEELFKLLAKLCHIHWSAKEWAFRVALDIWVVYFGMLVAIAYIKVRELRLSRPPAMGHCAARLNYRVRRRARLVLRVRSSVSPLNIPTINGTHTSPSFLSSPSSFCATRLRCCVQPPHDFSPL
jgi:hypothetical protein